jgi:serine/threonine protein kinase
MPVARRFQLQEVVGRGGFGTVYRANMLTDDGAHPVALKILNADVADQNIVAERLRDEARILSLLQHRAIVRVDGLFQLDGRWTVVMEFVEGVNLRHLLHAGPVPVGCALAIIEQAAAALHYAYEMPAAHGRPLRLIHRDIKPSNIHITPSGDVKLLDFGVAWGDFQERESVTRSLMFGSLEYMAPERLDSIDSHAGDMYGLGTILYELLVGEPLGRASGNRDRHNEQLFSRLSILWSDYPDEELYRLVADCLAYDDARRPPARILERRARAIRSRYSQPWLGAWAAQVVPPLQETRGLPSDKMTGSILTENLGYREHSGTRRRWPMAILAVIIAVTALGLWGRSATLAEPEYMPELLPSIDEVSTTAPSVPDPPAQDAASAEAVIEAPPPPPARPTAPAVEVAREALPLPAGGVEVAEVAPSDEPLDGAGIGAVLVQGEFRSVQLQGVAGTLGPGQVPAGTYAVSVSFDGESFLDSGSVEVSTGQQVRLVCRENLRRCVAR